MSLINCGINLDLICSKKCLVVASNADQKTKFTIINLYVPVVTLLTQYNVKQPKQLKMEQLNINQIYQQKDKTNI